MKVRPATFRDMAQVQQLYEDAGRGISDLGDSLLVREAALIRFWYGIGRTLSGFFPGMESAEILLVAEAASGAVVGFAQARSSLGRHPHWEVLNLCLAPSMQGTRAGRDLLLSLSSMALEKGIYRLTVKIPLDHPVTEVFLHNGFVQYATEQILYHDTVFTGTLRTPGMRDARKEDVEFLYLLYLRSTPPTVAEIEGATRPQWQAAFQSGCMGRLGRAGARHMVLEDSGIRAWSCITQPSPVGPVIVCFLCEQPAMQEEFIDATLNRVRAGPVSCVLRHYDGELMRILQDRGFAIYGSQLLFACDLRKKASGGKVLHLGSTRKVKVSSGATAPVHVSAGPSASSLTTTSQRRETSSLA